MLKIQCHGQMLLMILMVKKLLEPFMKKNFKKQTKKEFRIEKVIKKRKQTIFQMERFIHLIAGLIEMILYQNESILS